MLKAPGAEICHIYIYMDKKAHIIFSNGKYFSSFQKLCQCVIKLQTKIQITQQHNKSELKNTQRIKGNDCQGQNLIVPLQKKIIRRIS